MAKYFLGSVGKAEAFRRDANGNLKLAFVSKTLTDSGLNISTTKDDIRAGQGAPIQFSFYHDPSVEITLTDVLWKKEYLEAQLGANFNTGSVDYVDKSATFTNGVSNETFGDINEAPAPCKGDKYLVWGAPLGTEDYRTLTYNESDHKIYAKNAEGETDTSVNGKYCVRYLGNVTGAEEAKITSMIIPEELFLIITAPLFAGDACSPSKGKTAGHITFEVPRFQLNGAQEFAMNMSSNQTMSLAGIALADNSIDNCQDEGGKLLRIIEVVNGRDFTDDVVSIYLDPETMDLGDNPTIYGEIIGNAQMVKIPDSEIEYSKDGEEYANLTEETKLAVGKYTFRLKKHTEIATDEYNTAVNVETLAVTCVYQAGETPYAKVSEIKADTNYNVPVGFVEYKKAADAAYTTLTDTTELVTNTEYTFRLIDNNTVSCTVTTPNA